MRCLTLFLFLAASGNGIAESTAPKIDGAVWDRIDKVNSDLKAAPRPLPGAPLLGALGEARSVLESQAFYANYQAIRAWAFEHDFSQAEALMKRAGPAFEIRFDGDYDRHQIDYSYLKTLAAARSEAAAFLGAYPAYSNLLYSLNPSPGKDCHFPFNLEGAKVSGAKAKVSGAVAQWKKFRDEWKDTALRAFAGTAVRCLSEAASKKSGG